MTGNNIAEKAGQFADFLAGLSDDEKMNLLLKSVCKTDAGLEKAKALMTTAKKVDKNEEQKAKVAVATALLIAAHDEIKTALQPILTAHGIDLADGKRIVIHGGKESGDFLMDVSYADPIPDVQQSKGTRGQNPRCRGVIILSVPEIGLLEKVAENGTAAYSYLFNKGTSSFDTNKDAFEKSGLFAFEHFNAEKESELFMGTVERNVLTLTALGYSFFYGCSSKELAEKHMAETAEIAE